MASQDDGSVTRWIGDLKAGDDSAAQHLWERYFDRLVRLARARLRAARRAGADRGRGGRGPERLRQLLPRRRRGPFPRLDDRDDLWRLLVVITVRKVLAQVERQRRGSAAAAGWSASRPSSAASGRGRGLDRIVGDEPTPEFAAMVADEYRRLLDRLGDEALRQVLDLRLEGYTQRGDRRTAGLRRADGGAQARADPRGVAAGGIVMDQPEPTDDGRGRPARAVGAGGRGLRPLRGRLAGGAAAADRGLPGEADASRSARRCSASCWRWSWSCAARARRAAGAERVPRRFPDARRGRPRRLRSAPPGPGHADRRRAGRGTPTATCSSACWPCRTT